MRPVEFGEALAAARTQLTLFSDDKPDSFFTVIKFWTDEAWALRWLSQPLFPPTRGEDTKRNLKHAKERAANN